LSLPLADALAQPSDKLQSRRLEVEPATVRVEWSRTAVTCHRCEAPLPAAELATAPREGRSERFCPECGAASTLRRVPSWFRHVHAAATLLVGEDLDDRGTGERGLFVLCDVTGAEGPLPRDVDAVADFHGARSGAVAVAWRTADARGRVQSRLGVIDRRGLVLWSRDDLVFGGDTGLYFWPDEGCYVLVDRSAGTLAFVSERDGTLLRREQPPTEPDSETRLDARDHLGMTVDVDGTLLVRKRFGDQPPSLRRYSPQGERVPLWSLVSLEKETAVRSRQQGSESVAAIESLPHAVIHLPETFSFTVGWDGYLYVYDASGAAKYSRDGARVGVVHFDEAVVEQLGDLGVDRQGLMTLRFRHRKPFRGRHFDHLGTLLRGGTVKPWMGVHVPSSPFLLGDEGRVRMKVGPYGTVFLGGMPEELRVATRSGHALWCTPYAIEREEQLATRLELPWEPPSVAVPPPAKPT
jgi:hypothetical protein